MGEVISRFRTEDEHGHWHYVLDKVRWWDEDNEVTVK
jgi:hypothetical protein